MLLLYTSQAMDAFGINWTEFDNYQVQSPSYQEAVSTFAHRQQVCLRYFVLWRGRCGREDSSPRQKKKEKKNEKEKRRKARSQTLINKFW